MDTDDSTPQDRGLTRRQLMLAAVMVTIARACDSGHDGTADPTSTQAPTPTSAPTTSPTATEQSVTTAPTAPDSPTTTAASHDFPRTITHGLGETVMPSRPQRIVATADRDQLDVMLAMGVRPVQFGRSGDYGDDVPPWIDPTMVDGVETARMADPFLPNLELIASARPDLILDAWSDDATHQSLSSIAPTVQIKSSITDSWESAQRLAGEACGAEVEADAAIATTRQVLDDQAQRLAEYSDLSVAVAYLVGDQLGMLTGNEIGGRIVTELGMTVVSTPDGVSGNFSLEQIPALLGDADIIVSFDFGQLDAQLENPLFRALPAVAAGRYASVASDVASACYQESTLSMRWAAQHVADALVRAARGEGVVSG